MQVELKELQRSLGITFIFVTHDQEEALTLSDRIAIFNAGRIVQLGTPAEIYEHPTTAFVAGFVGTSNIFEPALSRTLMNRDELTAVRPERITLGSIAPAGDLHRADGTIAEVIYLGTSARILVDLDNGKRITVLEHRGSGAGASTSNTSPVSTPDGGTPDGGSDRRGERVVAHWTPAAVVVLEPKASAPLSPL